jgi:hypothetical protein
LPIDEFLPAFDLLGIVFPLHDIVTLLADDGEVELAVV